MGLVLAGKTQTEVCPWMFLQNFYNECFIFIISQLIFRHLYNINIWSGLEEPGIECITECSPEFPRENTKYKRIYRGAPPSMNISCEHIQLSQTVWEIIQNKHKPAVTITSLAVVLWLTSEKYFLNVWNIRKENYSLILKIPYLLCFHCLFRYCYSCGECSSAAGLFELWTTPPRLHSSSLCEPALTRI